ncbi:MAG: GNAT family N-acetyltransferase [Bacteroidia bacterium]|nr:GNAT family N-acetyltransferase [Bacteroidia bacterium]MBT8278037.1 GNAT family N-acetyltransferase [Bacteroidia bacterium]NND10758.1 GNAT family N-acetyltransferase [Flavobacteriaceae bacterium]NNF85779.1 GNAT family N-acetyltransferase [Winogradskyella sp.]
MGQELDILEITQDNSAVLTSFINTLNEEQKSFRYFKNRSLEALDNHIFTCLLMLKDNAVGYGHLDVEDKIVWLGIVIKKEYQGRGLAREIMQELLSKASEKGIENIHLSVDNDNERAIKLYEGFGFEVVTKKDDFSILRKKVSNIGNNTKLFGISTLAFSKKTREEIVALAKENDWTIEFSSSFPFSEDMIDFFTETDIKRLAHNYFPAPKEPFVINLASINNTIRQRSIDHCIQGLHLTKKCGAPYFTAHAGFCIDPDPHQLGRQLDVNVVIDRDLNWKYFLDSVQIILAEAEGLDLSFLIENNVTTKFNLRDDGQEVLFCSRAEEMIKLVNEISSDRFGLLLDTAHLKVSAQALNFNMHEAVDLIKPYVKYVHHSDNDGERDTNDSISTNYWFLPKMIYFEDCIHILEVKNINTNQIKNQLSLLN